jgi:hypothetical protein
MSYQPDPNLQTTPLTRHDLDQLRAANGGKGLIKNARALAHLLDRVEATMAVHRDQIQQLHHQISTRQLEQEHAGAATTLHPLDSFRFLSNEEKRRVMDADLQNKFDRLQEELESVQASRHELDRLVSQVKFHLSGIVDHPKVPSGTRDVLQAIIAGTLPDRTSLPVETDPTVSAVPDGVTAPPVGPVAPATTPAMSASPPAAAPATPQPSPPATAPPAVPSPAADSPWLATPVAPTAAPPSEPDADVGDLTDLFR